VVVTVRGRPFAVMSFTVADGKITEIDVIGDPERVRRIAAAVLTADLRASEKRVKERP
jgi:RNA polymerase sigma-70 factor (ECF subfamily)